ncbi:immediate early protein 2 [Antheraea proylei nucleopolyhedrovirus]|uniref:Ie-2 n=1 Tax=Antheraea proylei nucleopolyhedrovirus TaxID=2126611 RepID=A0A2Z6C5L3_NPVAP|nr:immediate early protein 2 [Antheraea proylei nucleopolyhedrovirus]AYW35353.1 ie-2 [Antheraea proylei nucleopolyhedrovirus]BBD50766.1 immediate early protein 2 [Antheraea proylei nucleopolyhedrovirus]
MSRSIDTNTPARRRNNLFLGRRIIYPPDTPRAAPRSTPVPRQQLPTPVPRQQLPTPEHVVDDRRAPVRVLIFTPPSSPPPASPPPAQVEVPLYCHICSCTYTNLQNYNSTFVTSTECYHAVCFKCYVSIVFNKEFYKCSVCNRTTAACRAYNRDGVVELTTVRTLRDHEAIKTHWNNLFIHNIPDSPFDDKNNIRKLEAQLDESRALAAFAQHKADMATSDNQMLKQQLECKAVQAQIETRKKLVLQQQHDALRAAYDKLQNQLDSQVAATKVKMEEFAQQHATLMENYKKLVDK